MKKYCLLIITLLSAVLTQAQFTEINGVCKRQNSLNVKLFKVISGRLEEMASVKPAANGNFNFKFEPSYQGFYVIGFGSPAETVNKFKLYVKGNDKINLELNDSTYVLTGVNTSENKILEAWQKLAFKIERRSVYFMPRMLQGFFPQHEMLVAKAKSWIVGKETGNASFDELMKTTIRYDLAYFALAFVSSSRASQPSPTDYNAYLKNFNADSFLKDEELFKFPYGAIMLRYLVTFKNKNVEAPDFNTRVMSISSDNLKGEYVLGEVATIKSYNSLMTMTKKYEEYFSSDDQKKRANQFEANLGKFRPGADAINFTYPDAFGKLVSLSDFKGKVVLVDVWATWCGPCVKEIPYLKALEKEFHNKDVVFLSVSIDEKKDEGKWKKFIVDSELGGIQLLAGGGGTLISKAYHISGIPRFMLFDKNGKIIEIDAARPSDPKLKEILLKYSN